MLVHIGDPAPDRWFWMGLYGASALFALSICKQHWNIWVLRILATASTAALFIFAAGFFSRTPELGPEWYEADGSGQTLALLIGTFCMLSIVAAYTCRMKCQQDSEAEEAHGARSAGSASFR